MTEILVILVVGMLSIAGATVLGPRLGVASPLVLVAVGVATSLIPAFASVDINPELILAGVLPPLLYSSAVSLPTMNFRREFSTISGLSVALVVISSLVLGLFFMLAIPDLGFAWGVALGAIVSPTDAVATRIVKQQSVSQRVIAMLDGESLLNDGAALVLLRTAIVATAATFSFWGAVGTFLYSVTVAVVLGLVVAQLDLTVRQHVKDPAVNTVLSFTVPFLASLPAEALGASGLVAAVIAGLYTGVRAPRMLSPLNRLSDSQNWRTVELLLEGAVFLTMGLQLRSIVVDVEQAHAGVWVAVGLAAAALTLALLVRAAYVAPLLVGLRRHARRMVRLKPKLEKLQDQLATNEGQERVREGLQNRPALLRRRHPVERFSTRVSRGLADVDYFAREPLGWREGVCVVWAGMRGAVTVAAAQTLPSDTPQRSYLVLVAYAVALLSLVIQGGTLGPLMRRIMPRDTAAAAEQERAAQEKRIFHLLRSAAEEIPAPTKRDGASSRADFEAAKQHRLTVIRAQRDALLDARDNGEFDADVLSKELSSLDASQIALELRG